MAILYKTDGSQEEITITNLEDLQQAVGGYIEVGHYNGDRTKAWIVDEEGVLKRKPLNPFMPYAGNVLEVSIPGEFS